MTVNENKAINCWLNRYESQCGFRWLHFAPNQTAAMRYPFIFRSVDSTPSLPGIVFSYVLCIFHTLFFAAYAFFQIMMQSCIWHIAKLKGLFFSLTEPEGQWCSSSPCPKSWPKSMVRFNYVEWWHVFNFSETVHVLSMYTITIIAVYRVTNRLWLSSTTF